MAGPGAWAPHGTSRGAANRFYRNGPAAHPPPRSAAQQHRLVHVFGRCQILHDEGGDIAAGDGTSTFFYDASAGAISIVRNHGAKLVWGTFTELLTIAAAASTDTSATLPAHAMTFAVSVRVVTSIPGTTNITVTNAASARSYARSVVVSSTAGSTDPGNEACPLTPQSASAQAIRITPDVTPSGGTGQVRLVASWCVPVAPTS